MCVAKVARASWNGLNQPCFPSSPPLPPLFASAVCRQGGVSPAQAPQSPSACQQDALVRREGREGVMEHLNRPCFPSSPPLPPPFTSAVCRQGGVPPARARAPVPRAAHQQDAFVRRRGSAADGHAWRVRQGGMPAFGWNRVCVDGRAGYMHAPCLCRHDDFCCSEWVS